MIYDDLKKYMSSFKSYTELRAQKNTTTNISILKGDIVGNSTSSQSGFSAMAFYNGLWGFASMPETGVKDFDEQAITKVINRAYDNAHFLGSKESAAALVKNILPSATVISSKDLSTTKSRKSQKDMIDFLKELDSYIKSKHTMLASRSVSLQCLDMEKSLVTSDGSVAYSIIPRTIISVSVTTMHDNQAIDLYRVFGGLGQYESVFENPEDLFSDIDSLVDNLQEKAKGIYPEAGIHDVILDSDLAGILSHEAIGHTVEADLVLGGSVAADFMNKEVASPLVTLVDFANTAFGKTCPVPVWIDDEGTVANDAILIDKGILKSYMHNKESAAHFNVTATGNARAYGFYDEPLIRMRNTAILPGTSKLNDMISSIDKGYYFMRASNGQADSTSEFMFGVVLGYEIKNGKLGRAIKDTTISGVAFDMLKTVTAISDAMSWSCAGMCGKKQMIPVGMGGPALRCRMQVGGRI